MPSEEIRVVTIWSRWLRVAHWGMAVGVILLAASGYAMDRDAIDPAFWRDWHVIVGQLLCFFIVLRIGLLAGPGSGNWRELLPRRADRPAIAAMLRFYITAGKTPLPNWYAHNPLWKPVYLLVLAALVASAASGLGFHGSLHLGTLSMAALHDAVSAPLHWFIAAHLVALFLHDLHGRNALVSAMISGERLVHIDRTGPAESGPVRVSLDGLRGSDRDSQTRAGRQSSG